MKTARSISATGSIGAIILLAGFTACWAGPSLPQITTVTTSGPCKAAMQTKITTFVVPGGSALSNPSAAAVTMVKRCTGAVTAVFTTEVDATTTPQQVRVLGLATCVATGGYATPHCTVGQKIQGAPGETTLKDLGAASVAQTHSATFVWTGLKRGKWRFDIKPVGIDNPELEYRSLVVEAYTGG